VTISPELLADTRCTALLDRPAFLSKVCNFVFAEGDCIKRWGSTFRSQYLYVGNLRHLLPNTSIPFYVTSATLPPHIRQEVAEILRLKPNNTEYIVMSNDRPNIFIVIREMTYAVNSYRDLAFLIPELFKPGEPPPPKFLVFFESTTAAENAARYLRSRLPKEYRNKVTWFHSTMSPEYRDETLEKFRNGDIWGMMVTDAFGMVCDLF
jgi:superfamily II DNA helicase RecQ